MHGAFRVLHAPFFVVPFLAQCIDRAAGNALPADVLGKMQAIGMMVVIGPDTRRRF